MIEEYDLIASLNGAETFYRTDFLGASGKVEQTGAKLSGMLLKSASAIKGNPALEKALFKALEERGRKVKKKKGVANAVSVWVIPGKSPAHRSRFTALTNYGLDRHFTPEDITNLVLGEGSLDRAYDKVRGKQPKTPQSVKAAAQDKKERVNRLSMRALSVEAACEGYVDISKVPSANGVQLRVALLKPDKDAPGDAVPIFVSASTSLIAKILEEWSAENNSAASRAEAASAETEAIEENARALAELAAATAKGTQNVQEETL